jgi:hypothetical protein
MANILSIRGKSVVLFFALAEIAGLAGWRANAQATTQQPASASAAASTVKRATAGDAPDNPEPLATGLSPALTHTAIRTVAEMVANWQLVRAQATFNQQWTYAALYDGFLATSRTTGDPRFHDAMVKMAEGFDRKLLGARFPHADDMALGRRILTCIWTSEIPSE